MIIQSTSVGRRSNTPIDGMRVRQSYDLECSYVTVWYRDEVVVEVIGVTSYVLPAWANRAEHSSPHQPLVSTCRGQP